LFVLDLMLPGLDGLEATGGRIDVVNRDGGCRFTVHLPAPAAVPGRQLSAAE
jgi:CheY-like chemotaxis protein